MLAAAALRRTAPARARLLDVIATTPQSTWLAGVSASRVGARVDAVLTDAARKGTRPTFVLYEIPHRDCGSYSSGGSGTAAQYATWVRNVAAAIKGRPVTIVLEPDSLAQMGDCLGAARRRERLASLRDAVGVLTRSPRTAVYLDGGGSTWRTPAYMAPLLEQAGIGRAAGFAVNVSGFEPTSRVLAYGTALSRLVGGKHLVIDTSRNGPSSVQRAPGDFCNPPGRALGQDPTSRTPYPLVDAYLWIKHPGVSDGPCRGGPAAGVFWVDYALGLVQRR